MAVPAVWGLWSKVSAIPRVQMISRGARWLIGRASDSGARGAPAIPRVQMIRRGVRWLSGRASDSGARGRRGFDTYLRRAVSLSKTLYSPKVLVIQEAVPPPNMSIDEFCRITRVVYLRLYLLALFPLTNQLRIL